MITDRTLTADLVSTGRIKRSRPDEVVDLMPNCMIRDWVTVSVTPLAGWVNHYEGQEATACPALLTQEWVSITKVWNIPREECSYEIDAYTYTYSVEPGQRYMRVVPAGFSRGELIPAVECWPEYLGTSGPGDRVPVGDSP